MMLVEDSQVPEAALPVATLREHLRLGTGFGADDLQDSVLASFLRAAIAAVEARTSKALITRGFVFTNDEWKSPGAQPLPIAPVRQITEVVLIDRFGSAQIVDPGHYRLRADSIAPEVRPTGTALPAVPTCGAVEVRFDAGYGAAFSDVPADLAQAVMLLAAHYYEYRDETALSQGCMPFGVTSLIARYRPLRMGLGA